MTNICYAFFLFHDQLLHCLAKIASSNCPVSPLSNDRETGTTNKQDTFLLRKFYLCNALPREPETQEILWFWMKGSFL